MAEQLRLNLGDTIRLEVHRDGHLVVVPMEVTHLQNGSTVMNPRVRLSDTEERAENVVLMNDRNIVKNGRSQAITIPNVIADELGLQVKDKLRLEAKSDGTLVITPLSQIGSKRSTAVMTPKKLDFKAPRVVPVLPAGRTIRGKNPYLQRVDLNALNQ